MLSMAACDIHGDGNADIGMPMDTMNFIVLIKISIIEAFISIINALCVAQ